MNSHRKWIYKNCIFRCPATMFAKLWVTSWYMHADQIKSRSSVNSLKFRCVQRTCIRNREAEYPGLIDSKITLLLWQHSFKVPNFRISHFTSSDIIWNSYRIDIIEGNVLFEIKKNHVATTALYHAWQKPKLLFLDITHHCHQLRY